MLCPIFFPYIFTSVKTQQIGDDSCSTFAKVRRLTLIIVVAFEHDTLNHPRKVGDNMTWFHFMKLALMNEKVNAGIPEVSRIYEDNNARVS